MASKLYYCRRVEDHCRLRGSSHRVTKSEGKWQLLVVLPSPYPYINNCLRSVLIKLQFQKGYFKLRLGKVSKPQGTGLRPEAGEAALLVIIAAC